MNVLFLFVSFNGIGDNRGMYGDLVVEFAKEHNVYVMAPSKKGVSYVEKSGRVSIFWVKTLQQINVGFVKKAIANFLLPYQFRSCIKKELPQKIDLIISPTPPITFSGIINHLRKIYQAKFFLVLRDIFPQNSVDLGIIKEGSLIYSYYRKKESLLYKISDCIGCMSPGNIDYILKHNCIQKSKLVLLPNWLEVRDDDSNQNSNGDEVVKKYNLVGKKIAIFGGNLGIAQQPDNIIDLAKLHKDKKDLVFVIIGKGLLKNKISDRIEKEHIENVKLLDYIPRQEYDKLIRHCSIGLVSLNKKFTIPNIPSRTLGYWKAKLPIFAIVDENTDYGINILEKHHGGVWCTVGDVSAYIEKFNRLYNESEEARRMGEDGYDALREYYNVKVALNTILNNI